MSFASKQLKTVAFSSCEAEYAAASYACKEIEFVRNICFDMGVSLQGRLVLALDNTAAILGFVYLFNCAKANVIFSTFGVFQTIMSRDI